MGRSDYEVEVATGRRATDGRVRISVFAGDFLALAIEGHGERVPTLLLTREQASKMQKAFAELIPQLQESAPVENVETGRWPGTDRRKTGELR